MTASPNSITVYFSILCVSYYFSVMRKRSVITNKSRRKIIVKQEIDLVSANESQEARSSWANRSGVRRARKKKKNSFAFLIEWAKISFPVQVSTRVCVCRHAHKYYAFITFNDSTKMLINYNSMMISAKTRGKSNWMKAKTTAIIQLSTRVQSSRTAMRQ